MLAIIMLSGLLVANTLTMVHLAVAQISNAAMSTLQRQTEDLNLQADAVLAKAGTVPMDASVKGLYDAALAIQKTHK